MSPLWQRYLDQMCAFLDDGTTGRRRNMGLRRLHRVRPPIFRTSAPGTPQKFFGAAAIPSGYRVTFPVPTSPSALLLVTRN